MSPEALGHVLLSVKESRLRYEKPPLFGHRRERGKIAMVLRKLGKYYRIETRRNGAIAPSRRTQCQQ